MASTVLVANTGRPTGSAAVPPPARARTASPASLYGHGMDAAVRRRRPPRPAPRRCPARPALNTVLDLTVDGTVYPAIVKDLQRHPVRRNVTHIDFLQVNLDEEITVVGAAAPRGRGHRGRCSDGGLVDPAVDSIEVVTTPRNIPDEFVVDITRHEMDTVIRLADIADAGRRHRRPAIPTCRSSPC